MTVRTRAELATDFADNTSGNVTPANMRNFVDSSRLLADNVNVGATPSSIIQTATKRVINANDSIALPVAPTVGNTMLLIQFAGSNLPQTPPAGWYRRAIARDGGAGLPPSRGNVPSAQQVWAAVRRVQAGDTGSVAYTSTDYGAYALFELDGVDFFDMEANAVNVSGTTWDWFYMRPPFGAALSFLIIESDGAHTPAIDAGTYTLIATFTGTGNHYGMIAKHTSGLAGKVSGTFSAGPTWAMIARVSVAKFL